MRIVFMGTPPFAVPALDALAAAGHDLVAVYTQPPRPAGRRGRQLIASVVQQRAEQLGIPVFSPVSLRSTEAQAAFAAHDADVAVVAAYGLILPRPVLDAPRLGCLNIHASLLPRWRGAAPVERAILAGDAGTGVCIMQMEAGLDTGPTRLCRRTAIGTDDAEMVSERLAVLGAEAIVTVLASPHGHPPVPQPTEGITYAAKIDKAEARLDFTLPARLVARAVQAFSTRGAFFEAAGERIKVRRAIVLERQGGAAEPPGTIVDLIDTQTGSSRPAVVGRGFAIACEDGYLVPKALQRPGRGWVSNGDFLRGQPDLIGTIAT